MLTAMRPYRSIVIVLGVIVLVAAAALAWPRPVSQNASTLFWEALRTTMTEPGLTCTISDTANGSSTKQVLSLDLASKTDVRALTKISQPNTVITTEQLDTKDATYIRYTALQTTQVRADGTRPDLGRALNVWSKAPAAPVDARMFGKTVLGNCVAPLADLSKTQVEPLLQSLRQGKVFASNFSQAKLDRMNSKPVRIYDITIAARPYIDFMKQVGMASGVKTLESVQAASYNTKSPQKLKFYISTQSGQLQQISYVGRQRSITFSDYGIRPALSIPRATVSTQQLQQLLEAH